MFEIDVAYLSNPGILWGNTRMPNELIYDLKGDRPLLYLCLYICLAFSHQLTQQ